MTLKSQLKALVKVKRHAHHPLLHAIHKKHSISKKTLFYVKEYGPRANVSRTIIRESIRILLLASILSSLGGLALEHIKGSLIIILPLIVLLPTMNDMIGDYGTIVSARFSTMLHERKIDGHWKQSKALKKLYFQLLLISFLTACLGAGMSLFISGMQNYSYTVEVIAKVFFIAIVDVILLVSILFLISIIAGLYFFRKNEDPNNFLIPITTSVADFGNMIILAVLILLLF